MATRSKSRRRRAQAPALPCEVGAYPFNDSPGCNTVLVVITVGNAIADAEICAGFAVDAVVESALVALRGSRRLSTVTAQPHVAGAASIALEQDVEVRDELPRADAQVAAARAQLGKEVPPSWMLGMTAFESEFVKSVESLWSVLATDVLGTECDIVFSAEKAELPFTRAAVLDHRVIAFCANDEDLAAMRERAPDSNAPPPGVLLFPIWEDTLDTDTLRHYRENGIPIVLGGWPFIDFDSRDTVVEDELERLKPERSRHLAACTAALLDLVLAKAGWLGEDRVHHTGAWHGVEMRVEVVRTGDDMRPNPPEWLRTEPDEGLRWRFEMDDGQWRVVDMPSDLALIELAEVARAAFDLEPPELGDWIDSNGLVTHSLYPPAHPQDPPDLLHVLPTLPLFGSPWTLAAAQDAPNVQARPMGWVPFDEEFPQLVDGGGEGFDLDDERVRLIDAFAALDDEE